MPSITTVPHLNSAGDAHAMQIFICSNCSGTATATGRHRTINHDYGHAIGLSHIDRNASGQVITGECPGYSVMQANPPTD